MNNNKELKLLEDIKKLLVLLLVRGFKVSSDEVGEVLGVTGRTVRKVATTYKKSQKQKEEQQ